MDQDKVEYYQDQQRIDVEIFDHKDQFNKKLKELHTLIVTLSSVILSLVGVLYTSSDHQAYCLPQILQIVVVLLLLNVALGITSLYGMACSHLDIIKHIANEAEIFGPTETLNRNAGNKSISQKKIYIYSQTLVVPSFLLSLSCLALFALLNIS